MVLRQLILRRIPTGKGPQDLGLMDLEGFRKHCLSKGSVKEEMPFGDDTAVFKVAGKMFALAALDDVPATVNLKCDPDLALELRDRYEQVQPGYHMNKRHWNTVVLDGAIADGEIRRWIDHSYDLVVQSLPRSRRQRLSAATAQSKGGRRQLDSIRPRPAD